jgi:anti-sigma-K factor RskA
MEPDRLDLSALDPARDRVRWEGFLREVMRRAEPELARRAARNGVLGVVGSWVWPTLSAAAVAAIVSGAALTLSRTETEPATLGGVVQALGVAEPVSTWLMEERAPVRADLVALLQGEIE